MPKRGGGSGGSRYNGGTGNGNNGGLGSRYSSLAKDFDEVEDHLRRKDRNKRRVSFKPSKQGDGNIRIGLDAVHRWDDDDDMGDITNPLKGRQSSRRRGSPIPRGKFGKLVPNVYGWYQVTIHNGQTYEKEKILRALLAAMSPHVFIPQYWREERNNVIFYTDDFELAERIQQLGRHAQLSDGFRLMPRVCSGIPHVNIDDAFKERMKVVMAKRYNAQTKALDLSRFHADPDLKETFCPLFRANVMIVALEIVYENIPDLEAINLNDNCLATVHTFKGIEKRLPSLKILYLGDNKIHSLTHLLVFRNLPIVELVLRNNPFRSRYKDTQQFVSEVRRKFPKVTKLDGETLPPQIDFDLQESTSLPPNKASYLSDSAGAEVVRQFLDQYFNIFDSNNRQPLLDAYHEQAMLSISMPSASQAGRLDKFWKFNRNLRRMVNDREDQRTRNLKTGRLACVSALDEWPRTSHERRTFTVDLTIYNPQMIVFTVSGLFKELSASASSTIAASMQAYELRYFMRTFVVVPQNNGFCIRNEVIFITTATTEQMREFKRSQHTPAPISSATNMPSTSLQGRLQPQSRGASILPPPQPPQPQAPATTTAAMANPGTGAPPDEVTKMQMIQTMSAQSRMNFDWSRKCLEETNWDYSRAAFVFDQLFKENKIPPEAFVK
ncbi:nuclear RNA export factor 1 [Scaptodrosophila lebanonensis]|uniref:Nuclear RNA export factor 1 n=1 Tax=Drosophila lebanonensis TaxID=7225 RepID=A0A6J2TUW3_DROLE|nr:nuclear RNA export factor 1 [Scaptodrosophila lebanonensis]